jgi:hypothetical protein
MGQKTHGRRGAVSRKRSPTNAKNSKVGYRSPPAATRFKPGQSGNPKGRSKGTKSFAAIIEQQLQAKVVVEEEGRLRTVSAQEAIIINLVRAAACRDIKAVQALFALRDRYSGSAETTLDPAEFQPEDREIISAYLAKLTAGGHPAPQSSTPKKNVDSQLKKGEP